MKPHIWNPEGQSLSNRRIRGSLNGKGPRDCPATNGGSHARTRGPLRVHEAWRDSSAEPLRTQRCPRAGDARSPPPSSSCGWRGSQPRLVVLAPMLWAVMACQGSSETLLFPRPLSSVGVSARPSAAPFRSGRKNSVSDGLPDASPASRAVYSILPNSRVVKKRSFPVVIIR